MQASNFHHNAVFRSKAQTRRQDGFTLIELLIVIAIIGILLASIAVAVTKAKEFANNSDQKSNMKQLVTACRVMEVELGRLPPAWDQNYGNASP